MPRVQAEGPAAVKAFAPLACESGARPAATIEEKALRVQLIHCDRSGIVAMSARLVVFADTEVAIKMILAAASKPKRSRICSLAYDHAELGNMLQLPIALFERDHLRRAYARCEGFGDPSRPALQGSVQSAPAYERAMSEPIIAAAEAAERLCDRSKPRHGGHPDAQYANPSGRQESLAMAA